MTAPNARELHCGCLLELTQGVRFPGHSVRYYDPNDYSENPRVLTYWLVRKCRDAKRCDGCSMTVHLANNDAAFDWRGITL